MSQYDDPYTRLSHLEQDYRILAADNERLKENARLAIEAATADQDWKRAEQQVAALREALEQIAALEPSGYESVNSSLFGRARAIARTTLDSVSA